MKLLVVEDARVMAISLKRQLGQLGFSDVEIATSAEEALVALQEQTYDALLLDWMLPRMSGLELLRMLRKSRRLSGIPVVMTTSNDDRSDVIEAFEAGATDYIVKPYDRAALEEKMTRLAERCRKDA